MTDRFSEQAAKVVGPIAAADATWRTGVVRVAFTGASQSLTLPARDTSTATGKKSTVSSRFLRVLALGANSQFAFGAGSAPTLVASASGYQSAGTPNAGAGMTLVNGLPEQLMVPNEATHLAFFGDASTTGFFELYLSEGNVA